MTTNSPPNNPLEFAQNLWGKMGFSLPGMVTPTFDVNELEKRLVDLKAVEGWLKMNLSMLQMTIQTLEMQCTTLNAVKQMSNIKPDLGSMPTLPFTKPTATKPTATKPTVSEPPAKPGEKDGVGDALQATMWPWALMQQIQTQMQEAMEKQVASATKPEKSSDKPSKNSS